MGGWDRWVTLKLDGKIFLEIAGTKKRQNEVGDHKKFCSQPSFCNEKSDKAEESEWAKGLGVLQFVPPLLPL